MVITAVFVIFIMGGIAVFALFGGMSRSSAVGSVVIWGTMDARMIEPVLTEMNGEDRAFENVTYIEKAPETYERDLLQAFASGKSPDMFLMDDTNAVSFRDKIVPVPSNIISQRNFNDNFIDEAQVFQFPDGIIALPLYVDPLVMYWNRDLFAGAGVASYPRAWSELSIIAPKMTALDTTSNVKRSAVALGAFDNVRYAKQILTALFMQVGDSIDTFNIEGKLQSKLGKGDATAGIETPAQAALRFYTQFSNSAQSTYSWNRALPNSFNAFASGDLGIYFGLASDYIPLRTRNPNLAFDVALLPQTGSAKAPLTYGKITALAVPIGASNRTGALIVLGKITGTSASKKISQRVGLPSARRDLLQSLPERASDSVFAQSALISRTWHDPDSASTNTIFKEMVESTISGKLQLGEAITNASAQLDDVYLRLYQ